MLYTSDFLWFLRHKQVAQWQSTYLICTRLWVQAPVPKTNIKRNRQEMKGQIKIFQARNSTELDILALESYWTIYTLRQKIVMSSRKALYNVKRESSSRYNRGLSQQQSIYLACKAPGSIPSITHTYAYTHMTHACAHTNCKHVCT